MACGQEREAPERLASEHGLGRVLRGCRAGGVLSRAQKGEIAVRPLHEQVWRRLLIQMRTPQGLLATGPAIDSPFAHFSLCPPCLCNGTVAPDSLASRVEGFGPLKIVKDPVQWLAQFGKRYPQPLM